MDYHATDDHQPIMSMILNVDAERQNAARPMTREVLAEMRQVRREIALWQRFGLVHSSSISHRELAASPKCANRFNVSGNF